MRTQTGVNVFAQTMCKKVRLSVVVVAKCGNKDLAIQGLYLIHSVNGEKTRDSVTTESVSE